MNDYQTSLKAFFIKNNNLLNRVLYSEVLWINAEGNYCIIQTETQKHILKISLKKLKEHLPPEHFIQIQRGYIVAIDKIENVDTATNQVIIKEKSLPLGRNYQKSLLSMLPIIK